MRSKILVVLLGGGCATYTEPPNDSVVEGGTDSVPGDSATTPTGETDTTPTDTSDPTPLACDPWSLSAAQRFDQQDLFGDEPFTDLGHTQGPGVSLADLDGDGFLDAILSVSDLHSVAFRNDGAGRLTPTDAFTLDGAPFPEATSLALADLDGDLDVDGVLTRGEGTPDLLIWNDGTGRFTSEALPDSDGESISPSLGDFDGDGWLDIFTSSFDHETSDQEVAAGVPFGDGSSLHFHLEGARWTSDADHLPAEVRDALTHHAGVADVDTDGDLDLMLANESVLGFVDDALLLNDGTGRFTVADDAAGVNEHIAGMGVAVGDPNGDGKPDLYVTNNNKNKYYLNLGAGTYYEARDVSAADPVDLDSYVGWGAVFVDLDGDGWEDLPITYGLIDPEEDAPWPDEQPDAILHNDGDGTFTDITAETPFGDLDVGRTVAVGDLDRDGRPDLVVAGRVYLAVFLSAGGCPPGITLQLDAGPGNRDGIGTWVDVNATNISYRRWMLPSVTYGSSASELYLGLNGSQETNLVIGWPDGTTRSVRDVAAGQILRVTK